MQKKDTALAAAQTPLPRSARERIGLLVDATDTAAGAAKSERPVPPLVAHIPVALSKDRQAVLAAARSQLSRYGRLPFYANMFADAGLPVAPDGTMTDALLESLVVSGDEAIVAERLTELLEAGLDELLVMSVQVAASSGEQARLARLIGQI